MFRYVALAWDESDPGTTSTARLITHRLEQTSFEWEESLLTPGLAVFHIDARPNSSEAYVTANGRGVVLGKLFKTGADTVGASIRACLDNDSAEIVRTEGRHLVREYWGRYVAFHKNRESRSVWVLRDPMGALPCFATEFRGVQLFFSCIEDCLALNLLSLSLNWNYLAAYIRYGRTLQTHETGIKQITEIQPGECWEIHTDGSVAKNSYWQPTEIAQSNTIESVDKAVEALRSTTQMCVSAWGSCYSNILHLLSGGLDSSIVASCLRRSASQPTVDCLTYFNTDSPAGDERRFAKAVADRGGYSLTAVEERASETDLRIMMRMIRSPTPWPMQYYATHSPSENEVARAKKAQAIFYGSGGDQIFFQSPVPLTAVDYAHRRGLGRDLFRMVAHVARETRLSFWSLLAASIRDGWLERPWNPQDLCRRMSVISPELQTAASLQKYLAHPWLTDTQGLPWGKLEHIRMMSVSHDFYNPLAPPDGPERVRPLVSQPLIELCLKIPTYVLAAKGFDRVIARRAFAQDLPREIVTRRNKGVISHYFHQLLHHNRDFIREMMIDGFLIEQGLLDRGKVLAALNGERASFGPEAAEIVAFHLGTEAWIRRWSAGNRKIAA